MGSTCFVQLSYKAAFFLPMRVQAKKKKMDVVGKSIEPLFLVNH